MRVSVSLCTAIVLAMSASTASAMDANEIFNRLKAQAGATDTVGGVGGVRRGLAVSYGDEPEAPAAAAPAQRQSVVAVPAAVEPTATQAAIAAPSAQPSASPAQPTFTAVAPAAAPVPAYTLVEPAAPAPSVTIAAPTYVPAQPAASPSFQPAPSYAQIPTYTSTPVETPIATPVAARPSAASYTSVDQDQRIDLRIYFEWNSASLKPEAIGQLAELCTAIRRVGASPDNRFKIIGHTDKSGSDEYNLYLSNARAREVKRHLVEECSLPSNALLAVGEGERQSSPSTPANAPEERRVEIQFVS